MTTLPQTTRRTPKPRITSNKKPSWMGIARYLTGTDLERMIGEYNRGELYIRSPKGQSLTRTAFVEVAAYLRWDDRLAVAA
jgi:hypothetical protein